ncbi:hypothetical protein RF11_07688 [Thelohanellus kitauei]|uniref:Uncharacterized protein n=1 Tax=Thelohanellus kitauei TaxID=669202 RepID=A0A0C2MJE2_THEKT|nr:hypothetical protein RF11_07688 [Thelohanellus kitauei]
MFPKKEQTQTSVPKTAAKLPRSTPRARDQKKRLTALVTTTSSTPTVETSMSKSHKTISLTQFVKSEIKESETTIMFKQVSNKQIPKSDINSNVKSYSFIGCIIFVLVVMAFKSEIKRLKLNK